MITKIVNLTFYLQHAGVRETIVIIKDTIASKEHRERLESSKLKKEGQDTGREQLVRNLRDVITMAF